MIKIRLFIACFLIVGTVVCFNVSAGCKKPRKPRKPVAITSEVPAQPGEPLTEICKQKKIPWPLKNARMIVDKKKQTLQLLSGETPLKTYPVAFGSHPQGPKEREGDGRTPEGTYYIFKYSSPSFGRAFYIAYPNRDDAQRGLHQGLIDQKTFRRITKSLDAKQQPPAGTGLGGYILLHGVKDRTQQHLTDTNWTLGCIAMENAHILELLDAIPDAARPEMTILPFPVSPE